MLNFNLGFFLLILRHQSLRACVAEDSLLFETEVTAFSVKTGSRVQIKTNNFSHVKRKYDILNNSNSFFEISHVLKMAKLRKALKLN
jgi:hypothetical protein